MNCDCCGERLRVRPVIDNAGDRLCDACADLLVELPEEDDA